LIIRREIDGGRRKTNAAKEGEMVKEARKPGIDSDELENKALNEISAADFLAALGSGSTMALRGLHTWPEKKKYELLIEPENYSGIKVVDIIRGIHEKKKVEYEKAPGPEEGWRNPRDYLRDPEFIRDIAREVANQLRQMR
jgi:hypothetical protein